MNVVLEALAHVEETVRSNLASQWTLPLVGERFPAPFFALCTTEF